MKKILVTWHFTSHGIGYLKNILGAFHLDMVRKGKNGLYSDLLEQTKMHAAFDSEMAPSGIEFDRIYYLTVQQKMWDKISTRHNSVKRHLLVDPLLKGNHEMLKAWEEICSGELTNLEQDREFIARHYPSQSEFFDEILWRTIHKYPVEDQIRWFCEMSNAGPMYEKRLNKVEVDRPEYGLKSLRDPVSTTQALRNLMFELREKHPEAQFYIKVSLAIFQIQLGWYLLAESNYLPPGTRFLMSYDRKDTTDKTIRFRDFYIEEVPSLILSKVREVIKPYDTPLSKSRELANKKMQVYMDAGFAILLLGERGTGKSRLAQKYKGSREHFAVANCGAFDNDLRAEEELFGYVVKYRRSSRSRVIIEEKSDGLFQRANGGVLFLDDIHYLSEQVQAKLMRALETDQENNFRIKRVGDAEEMNIKCKVIMASNRSLGELKRLLLPDFYDRVVQNVIHMPTLAESPLDREDDWARIWKQMQFDGDAPNEPDLMKWLKTNTFPGNYRDLQKFAIYYNNYQNLFDPTTQKLTGFKSAFEYAKKEFEKFHQLPEEATRFNFSKKKNADEMLAEYRREMAEWALAVAGSTKGAWELLGKSKMTFYNWMGG